MEFNFSRTESLVDANASVEASRDLLDLLQTGPDEDVEALSQAYHNLSVALSSRRQLPENQKQARDLDEAITKSSKAVSIATRCGSPELSEYRSQLGRLLRIRSANQRSEDLARTDIQGAVSVLNDAVTAARTANRGLDSVCNAYGSALQARYEHLGDPEDLKQAIRAHEEAANHATDGDIRGGCLSNLANARLRLFEHNGSVDDIELNNALEESKEAVELTSQTCHDRPGRLVNLSNALQMKFEHGGKDRDHYLFSAVEKSRDAVSAARAIRPDRLDHGECLGSLGLTLTRLFERTHSEQHLSDAIKSLRKAVGILSKIGENTSKYEYSLACCLKMRGTCQDLDDAIKALEKAIEQTPMGHKDQLAYLTVKANVYGAKYSIENVFDDLDEMVRLSQLVVDQSKTQDIAQFRGAYQTNLAVALAKRHRAKSDSKSSEKEEEEEEEAFSDLDFAIQVQEAALSTEFAAEDHPMRATCLHNLGMFLADRYAASGEKRREDRIRAIEVHIEALNIESADPSQRIKSGRRAMHLIRFGNPKLSAKVMQLAVELLPLVSPAALDWDDQQRQLKDYAGLASRAAVMALEAKWPDYNALRLLEIGRGVMITLQLGLRADLESVEKADKNLAARFKKLRNELNAAPTSLLQSIPSWQGKERAIENRENRHEIWQELQKVECLIREHDELRSFNDALPEEEMAKLQSHEHIVVFNVDKIRSDAFLVTRGSIRAILLPNLKLTDIEKYAKMIRDLTKGTGRPFVVAGEANQSQSSKIEEITIERILKWLWDTAVQKILAELGIIKPLSPIGEEPFAGAKEQPQRIWWVTSGWLSMLPIHAAGDYSSPGSTTNALDMVISSYAPTLKSRKHAVEKAEKLSADPITQALLVSAKGASGLKPLLGAEIEVDRLEKKLGSLSINCLLPPAPTKSETILALQQCQLCHFACHGYSHPSNPSSSLLAVSDQARLPMREVAALNLSSARLAYLSACFVADNRAEDLLDESLHLAAAFLLAGFPFVVGTLWRIQDLKSAMVADKFYSAIVNAGATAGLDIGRSAAALNRATRILRKELGGGADKASIWAPYIHLGA
ncbi:hypothetical protein AYO21_06865 [Fonsecaea monophora]|uniref:CHAT domain-containing protein n=1 Tax=Fonsecaea monophora TaxID=254056 RepID=A0A177F3C7_9EURO|nr:hypothetical protein AYO21_06865 [Fonsecaea monophora]KAH0841256.1 hypothetical protein FOPE_06096 [Fonsecaea pedrosoi]OAG38834.1 hypothetical protein AYO21_06865 [Fonsecaea monophora]